eukprot:3968280-Amphidinium_carterae.1
MVSPLPLFTLRRSAPHLSTLYWSGVPEQKGRGAPHPLASGRGLQSACVDDSVIYSAASPRLTAAATLRLFFSRKASLSSIYSGEAGSSNSRSNPACSPLPSLCSPPAELRSASAFGPSFGARCSVARQVLVNLFHVVRQGAVEVPLLLF